MRLGALTLVLLLLAPGAAAGSARDPDIRDAAELPDHTAADVVAAWFESEESGLRFSIRTVDGSRPERFPDHIYWFLFTIEATGQQSAAIVGFGNDGVLRTHLTTGPDSGGLDGPRSDLARGGMERWANGALVGLREERGRPSTWSAVVPWGAFEGFEPGAALVDVGVGASRYERGGRGWTGASDVATMEDALVLREPGVFPILVPAWMIPTIVVACLAGGALAGAGLARATRPKPAPVRALTPVAPRVAPPGERFRVAPGQRR